MLPGGHSHGQIPVVVTVEADQGVDQGVGHLSIQEAREAQEALVDQDGHQWDQVEEAADQEDLEVQEEADQEDLEVQVDQAIQAEAEEDQVGDH